MPIWSLFWRSSNSITDLESSLSIYEPLVWISGALVFFGVVLEVVADRSSTKDSRNAAIKRWGEYLLIVGLGGEIAFGIATSVLSGLIIAKLNLVAANAETTAKGFDTKIVEARRGTAEAQKDAETAKKDGEQLKKDNLVLEAELLKLRLRIADRHLTREQKSRISQKLCEVSSGELPLPSRPANTAVQLELYDSDNEIASFAQDIAEAIPSVCQRQNRPGIGWGTAISNSQATIGFSGVQVILRTGASARDMLFTSTIVPLLVAEGAQTVGPMAEPRRGTVISGGGQTFLGTGAFIVIAIGKKP
ncbi:MAG TPA: hypothetical protein VGR73_15415 [Bryobacteraceae bacterium]|nr:hypothetical protein [Bryobacteraceae bacterium]